MSEPSPSETKPPIARDRSPIALAQALQPFAADELRAELRRRHQPGCSNCVFRKDPSDFKADAAEEARHRLERGELREAGEWIGRAHPHFARLSALLARILPSAAL